MSGYLSTRPLSPAEWIGGFVSIALVVTPTVAIAAGAAAGLTSNTDEAPTEVVEEEIIAARFVQLGRDFQDELPNRIVPEAATAPPDSVALSDDDTPERREQPEQERERPPDALDRSIDNLLDAMEPFAEEQAAREREGSPDGIEEGTETEASDGDLYAGQIRVFFRRGWTVPTTISEEERRSLQVEATVTVTENLQIVRYVLRGSSGNPDFDQSVRSQLDRLRENNVSIPEPPLTVRHRYVGVPFTAHFRGREAR